MPSAPEIPFSQIIEALLDEAAPLHPRNLYRLTDLSESNSTQLELTWPRIALWRRQAMLEDLKQLGETNLLLSFEAVSRIAVKDPDPIVRSLAMGVIYEYDATDLIPYFLQQLENNTNPLVRASAASVLGRFVYKGELDELPQHVGVDIENHLLKVIDADTDASVRRLALEALSYSCREEIPAIIQKAFTSPDKGWVATALVCMGRSCDEQWFDTVTTMLDHKNPSLRAAAARAAGELEIPSATPRLIELADDSDEEVRQAAQWSLSQIGGEGVRATLEKLWESAEDDKEIELLENALDNLAFSEGMLPLSILDVPAQPRRAGETGGRVGIPSPYLVDEDDLLNREEEEDPDLTDGFYPQDLDAEADELDNFETGEDDEEDEEIDTETAYFSQLDEEDDGEDLSK